MLLKEGADPEVIFSSFCTYNELALINQGYIIMFEDKKHFTSTFKIYSIP